MTDDAAEPSKTEFRRVLTDEQLGIPLEDALKVAIKRMENKDLDQVALVAKLQREMGSNSAEVLDRVVEAVRTRMDLRRLIRSLTAQGRMSRWVLTLLPVGLAVVLTLLSTPTWIRSSTRPPVRSCSSYRRSWSPSAHGSSERSSTSRSSDR